MTIEMRIARPVRDLARAATLYAEGLGLDVLGSFEDHDGFDGVMLGRQGDGYHFELTHCRRHPVAPSPTAEDLVVFYIPDAVEWTTACERARRAGFREVASFNPYWARRGRTFEDADGYRVVFENSASNL